MVNDEVTKVRVNGDGSTKTVSFAFKYSSDSSIKVYKIATDVTPEVATLQVLNTDYTVAAGSPQGGVVTFTTAPSVAEDGFVKLDEPYTQAVDIPSGGVFREEAVEAGLDKPVILCQQLREEISRSIQLPETSDIASVSFDTPVADRALVWQDDGGGAWTAVSSASNPDDAATYASAAAASATESSSYATAASASVTSAQTAQGLAEDARDEAVAAAAAALIPDPSGNDLELLRANSGGTALEYSGVKISTDGTFAAASDSLIPTQNATKTYADGLVAPSSVIYTGGTMTGATKTGYEFTHRKFGNIVFFRLVVSGTGTGTKFTVTFPFTPTVQMEFPATVAVDNGAYLLNGPWMQVTTTGVLAMYSSAPYGAWTASGVRDFHASGFFFV